MDPSARFGYFYVNYQGTRQRSGASAGTFINTTIPYVPLVDRESSTKMAADCGVPSIDPVAFNLLNVKSNQFGGGAGGYLYPLPTNVGANTPCLTPVQFIVSETGKFTDDQFTTSWDRELRRDQGSRCVPVFLGRFGYLSTVRRRFVSSADRRCSNP